MGGPEGLPVGRVGPYQGTSSSGAPAFPGALFAGALVVGALFTGAEPKASAWGALVVGVALVALI